MSVAYPPARTSDDVVDLHGQSVPDPYRWLESTDSPETREWIDRQQALTADHLSGSSTREQIRERLTELWDFPKRSAPRRHGKLWAQWRNTGLQDQMVLYVMSSPDDEGRVLLDPNTMAADGTVAVTGASFTHDGSLLAYSTSSAGSDWRTWRVRDVETGEDLPDVLEWAKLFDAAWLHDGSGFYYSGHSAPEKGAELTGTTKGIRVLFHELGTPQSADRVVYERPDEPDLLLLPVVTDDGRFLAVTAVQGADSANELHVLDLDAPEPTWLAVASERKHQYALLGNEGERFYLLTNDGASRRRVVRLELGRPLSEATTVVPEQEHQLAMAVLIGGQLVCLHLVDVAARLTVVSTDGVHQHDIPLPPCSTVAELSGDQEDSLLHFSTTSFSDPGTIWSHDVLTGETLQVTSPSLAFDRDSIVTEQVFVTSEDGTRVPVFLVHRKDVQPTGDVPALMYGYGGFNIALTPAFSVPRALWVERGGLLAIANLRGGGEYGVDWWEAGRLANKQNVFDDFCAVARWLDTSGWSTPSRIAINGGSNGGLLVGACMTQRPELFGAVVAEVGVLDMLRFHEYTVGWAWTTDYGDPRDETAFGWLLKYSPLHNVRPGTSYPPTLVMTGDHDDRVVPAHSYKFAAALQAAQAGDAPVLLRIETATGHGLGKPTSKGIDERADVLAFLEMHVGQSAT